MKKRRKTIKLVSVPLHNLVAKHAHQFNRAAVFKDKSKYNRKAKHKSSEPFSIINLMIEKGSVFMDSTQKLNRPSSEYHALAAY